MGRVLGNIFGEEHGSCTLELSTAIITCTGLGQPTVPMERRWIHENLPLFDILSVANGCYGEEANKTPPLH